MIRTSESKRTSKPNKEVNKDDGDKLWVNIVAMEAKVSNFGNNVLNIDVIILC